MKKPRLRCAAKLAQKTDQQCSANARKDYTTCWNHREAGHELTAHDPRPHGASTVWGWPTQDEVKGEPLGAANKHCFPDLSPRSLCGRWKRGTKDVRRRVDVVGSCPKCRELQVKSMAGTWAPPVSR